jgi:hypothetical protein
MYQLLYPECRVIREGDIIRWAQDAYADGLTRDVSLQDLEDVDTSIHILSDLGLATIRRM